MPRVAPDSLTLTPPQPVVMPGEEEAVQRQRLSEFSQTIISEDFNIFLGKLKNHKPAHATGSSAQSNKAQREGNRALICMGIMD